jgi:hypothetical protein
MLVLFKVLGISCHWPRLWENDIFIDQSKNPKKLIFFKEMHHPFESEFRGIW